MIIYSISFSSIYWPQDSSIQPTKDSKIKNYLQKVTAIISQAKFQSLNMAMKVKIAQWSPTLCNPKDYTVHGILQARILEWAAFPFSRDPPNPGVEPRSPTLPEDSLAAEPQEYWSG